MINTIEIMKLELKKVSHSASLSEETAAFTADLWFDGKKVAFCRNDGRGGSTYVDHYEGMKETLKEVYEYAKSLPSIVSHGTELEMDLDFKLGLMIDEYLTNKEQKKNFNKGIVYEESSGNIKIISWKGYSISKLKKHPQGFVVIEQTVSNLKSKGYNVLNTNI